MLELLEIMLGLLGNTGIGCGATEALLGILLGLLGST